MTLREPAYTHALITPDGRLTPPLVQLLKGIVAAVQGIAPADLTAINTRLDELEQLPAQIEAIYGTNGVTVVGSLESGMEIRGSEGESILANQIFGG
jgi:hypothetical protein